MLNIGFFLSANTFCTWLADPQCHHMTCKPALCHDIATGGIATALDICGCADKRSVPSERNELLRQVTRPTTAAGALET